MPQWLVVTQQQVADGASYRDVVMRVWYHSTQGVSDSVNSFSTSGDHPPHPSGASVNISVPGSGGQGASQLIHERTTRISKQYGSTTSVYAAAWLSGIEYWGASQQIYDNSTYTVPARPYSSPLAPDQVSVSRNSDTSHTVSWRRRASTAGRYQNQYVQRRIYSNGSWGGWATVRTIGTNYTNYGSHTWTNTNTRADRGYEYRVRAANSTATTTSSVSNRAYTTPTAPSSVVATKLSNGDIRVRITPNQTSSQVNFQIQHQANGGSWSSLATISGSRSTTDYTHRNPNPADVHRYRVRTVINYSSAEGHGLSSGWRTSSTVQLAAPPNAPTGLGPSTPMDADTTARTLRWSHNPVDSSDQEAFHIWWRADGGAWEEGTPVASSTESWTAPAETFPNNALIEWAVRTRGQHANYSPWSAVASFVTSASPTVAIDSPEEGETAADSTASLAWTYYQEQDSPQAQWRAQLVTADGDGETVLETRQGSGTTSQVTFNTPVEDGQAYIGRVEVASAVGLWSEPVDVHFNVDYPPPALVDADLSWDRDRGAVDIQLSPQVWDGEEAIEPVAVTIQRSADGGSTWTVVERDLPIGGGVTSLSDPTPPTRAELLYHVTSISALPSTAAGEPVAITVNEAVRSYVNYGPDMSQVLVFYGNPRLGSQVNTNEVLRRFAGRDKRVLTSANEEGSLDLLIAADLLHSDSLATRADFEEAARTPGIKGYRDPSRRAIKGQLHGLQTTQTNDIVTGVAFNVSEAERV